MPLSSQQISAMIGQQQQYMNQQLGAPSPHYQNPGAAGYGMELKHTQPVSIMARMGGTALPMAAGLGAAMAGLDPITLGYRGLKSVVGGKGTMFAGLGSTLSRIGSVGSAGGLSAVGLGAGLAAAALPMAGAMILGKGFQYGVGQMVRGASVQAGMQSHLGSQFGFRGGQRRGMDVGEVGKVFDEVYNLADETKKGVEEISRTMMKMDRLQLFRKVGDVKQFTSKLRQTVKALNTVAKEYGVGLEDATRFLGGARAAGFHSTADQMATLPMTRRAEWATGLSRSAVQGVMAVGGRMSAMIGGERWRGAVGMAAGLEMAGALTSSGIVGQRTMEEATGAVGQQALTGFAQTTQMALARRLKSRFGRYYLAAAAGDDLRGLDQDRMGEVLGGALTMKEIKRRGRQAVYGEDAPGSRRFLMYEEEMRGQMMARGPTALASMVRSELGGKLYDTEDPRTNKYVRKTYGLSKRMAETVLSMARNLDSTLVEQMSQEEQRMTQQARGYGQQNYSTKLKKVIGGYFERNLNRPLQRLGATISSGIGEGLDRASAALMGETYVGKRPPVTRFTAGGRQAILAAGVTGGQTALSVGGMLGPTAAVFNQAVDTARDNPLWRQAGFSSAAGASSAMSGMGGDWRRWSRSASALSALSGGEPGALASSAQAGGGRMGAFLTGVTDEQRGIRHRMLSRRFGAGSALSTYAPAGRADAGDVVRDLTADEYKQKVDDLLGGGDEWGALVRGLNSRPQLDTSAAPAMDEIGMGGTGGLGIGVGILRTSMDESLRGLGRMRAGDFRGLMKTSVGGMVLAAAGGDDRQMAALRQMATRKSISGLSPGEMGQLRSVAGRMGDPEFRRRLVKAGPGLYSQQFEKYKRIVGRRMGNLGTHLGVDNIGTISKVDPEIADLVGGLVDDPRMRDPAVRGKKLRELFDRYSQLDAVGRKKLAGAFSGSGVAGGEFQTGFGSVDSQITLARRLKIDLGKDKDIGVKSGRRMLTKMLGGNVTSSMIKKLQSGKIDPSELSATYGLSPADAKKLVDDYKSGGVLTGKELRESMGGIATRRAQGSVTGEPKGLTGIADIIKIDVEGFGTAKGIHAELKMIRAGVVLLIDPKTKGRGGVSGRTPPRTENKPR